MAKFKFNYPAFVELRTSSGARELVEREANRIAGDANAIASTTDPAATDPYYEIQDGSTDRARLRVRAASRRAVRHESTTNALQKSM